MEATTMKDLRLITMLFILFAFANLFSYDIVGKVIAVKDGDTIEVLQGKETYRIRLFGIDCPEKNQAFGNKAKQFTSDKCFGKKVTVRVNNKDMYGRYVADVILPDGNNLNVLLVKNGLAWHYKAYSKDKNLAKLEENARKKRIGLWADKNPIAPWEFRKGKKPDYTVSKKEGKYIASKNSKKYHKKSCKQAKEIKSANAIYFKDKNDAKKAGYAPCTYCKP